MKNFNVYDPMKRGEGLVLDGQTLAHVEVLLNSEGTDDGTLLKLLGRCTTPSGMFTTQHRNGPSRLCRFRQAAVPYLALHASEGHLGH